MKKIVLIALALAAAVACEKNDGDERHSKRVDITLTKAQESYVEAANNLGLEMLDSKIQSEKNAFIFSPLSTQISLGMLSAGADGETADQINNTLGFAEDAEGTMQYLTSLCQQLKAMDAKTDFNISNSLLINTQFEDNILPEYGNVISDFDDAMVFESDFGENGPLADEVNSWSRKHTNGHIPEVISPEKIKKEAASYIINALYFKSKWEMPFEEGNTRDKQFTDSEGAVREVPMMNLSEDVKYFENGDLQAIELPYGNGAFSYTAILPRRGLDLADITTQLKDGLYRQITEQLLEARVDVSLPKYEQDASIDIAPIVSRLGLTLPFSDDANFGKMLRDYRGFSVTDFSQKVYFSLDESGAEATVIHKSEVSEVATPPADIDRVFIADHPFIYLVSETSSDTILFIGLYN